MGKAKSMKLYRADIMKRQGEEYEIATPFLVIVVHPPFIPNNLIREVFLYKKKTQNSSV